MSFDIVSLGFSPNLVDYREAWSLQQRLHREVVAGKRQNTVLLLEHAPVYTAGKRTEPHEMPRDGSEVIPVDRGGKITWHGPGQLVGYLILRLRHPRAILQYVQQLEALLMSALALYDIPSKRIRGRAGIWLARQDPTAADAKIASIGIRVHEEVTMHGFALNCNNDLTPFHCIVPCGLRDVSVTTMSEETGRDISPAELVPHIQRELEEREELLVTYTPGHMRREASPGERP